METHSTEEIMSVFREIDTKGLGYISSDDLRQILNHLDEPLSEVEVEEIISEIDKNNDGEIDFEEFCTVMMPNMK